jgi:proline dehydrogenase
MTHPRPDFQNTEVAFKHLSDLDLYRAWTLFRTINVKPLVLAGPPLVTAALKLRLPIQGLLRATVFKQFCGGETLEKCRETINQLTKGGVYSILDYGVEGEKSEDGFNAAMEEVLKTVTEAKQNPRIPFCVFKLTAIARFELLEVVSKSGTVVVPQELSDEWQRVENRVSAICEAAIKADKCVMIDAEETWIQPAIDHLALMMMRQHNLDTGKIYTTIQMYRSKGLADVNALLLRGTSEGFIPAIKLVRGAYMEKERERASLLKYESPIHPDKNATDRAYNQALKSILASDQRANLCAGTHNSESSRVTIDLMAHAHIDAKSPRVWFAQLLGMSDDLTFNLAHAGYQAAKYVPYGPIAAVLPYLFRRARENTSIAGQSGRELQLIERELRRRSGKKTD